MYDIVDQLTAPPVGLDAGPLRRAARNRLSLRRGGRIMGGGGASRIISGAILPSLETIAATFVRLNA